MDFLDFAKTTLCLIAAGFIVAVIAWGFVYSDTKSMQRDLEQLKLIKEQSAYINTLQIVTNELLKNEIDKKQEKIYGKKKK